MIDTSILQTEMKGYINLLYMLFFSRSCQIIGKLHCLECDCYLPHAPFRSISFAFGFISNFFNDGILHKMGVHNLRMNNLDNLGGQHGLSSVIGTVKSYKKIILNTGIDMGWFWSLAC